MTNYPCFTSCDSNNSCSGLLGVQLSSGGMLVKLLCYQRSYLNCSWEMADHGGFHRGKRAKFLWTVLAFMFYFLCLLIE